MPKQSSKKSASLHGSLWLLFAAIALFVGGEAVLLSRTDQGRITAARMLGIGDDARVTQLVGKQIRFALDAVGVPADSVRESILRGHSPPVQWRIGLRPRTSTLQVNYAISHVLETQGGAVLSGHETVGPHREMIVRLVVGLPHRATHEILLVRPSSSNETASAPAGGRLAVVVYGFGEDPREAMRFFSLPAPFAVAIPAGATWSPSVFQAAREAQREIVLHLPLEPINYPQVDPGPGAILVTMKPSKIDALLDKYLEQAGPVVAVANLMGSLATQDMPVMTAVFTKLHERGVPFLHVQPAAGSVCKSLAASTGVAYDEPDAVIDGETRRDTRRALDTRWQSVLRTVRRRGQGIVFVRATDLTREWLPEALSARKLQGIEVVPLTALVRRPVAL
jgi:polysaccharide deacetylase 2 family uncharacterized protein YibQ